MKRDRRLALMVLTAARGAVDFSQARVDDRLWWLRLNWLGQRLETDECCRVWQLEHNLLCAALMRLPPDSDKVSNLLEEAGKLTSLFLKHTLDIDVEAGQEVERRNLARAWHERWGNPQDKDTARRIEQTARALQQRNLQAPRRKR